MMNFPITSGCGTLILLIASLSPWQMPTLENHLSCRLRIVNGWGWDDALKDVGITVQFLCSDYVKAKYAEKIGS